jgi:hypothetical protein
MKTEKDLKAAVTDPVKFSQRVLGLNLWSMQEDIL